MIKKIISYLFLIVLCGQGFFNFAKETQGQDAGLVVINELMWMGSSLSYSDEWIELRNVTDQVIDLSGWYLTRRSSSEEKLMLEIPEGKAVSALGFFVISNYSNESTKSAVKLASDLVASAVALSNSSLQIKLYDKQGNLIDAADDGSGKPLAGEYLSGQIWKSMERNIKVEDGLLKSSWHTAQESKGFKEGALELGTPGQKNSNAIPKAVAGDDQTVIVGDEVFFDASESFDPDQDELTYNWDFGDGNLGQGVTPVHIYQEEGDFVVILTLSDGQNEANDSLTVVVEEKQEVVTKPIEQPSDDEQDDKEDELIVDVPVEGEVNKEDPEKDVSFDFSDKVLFNELFPNPKGLDKGKEFIELVNSDERDINLRGWKIFDGKKYFTFKESLVIKNQGFLALAYEDIKMSLKNAGQAFYLIDPSKKIINGVQYGKSKEGQSFSRISSTDSWAWTQKVTPGEENEFVDETENDEIQDEEEDDITGVKKVAGIEDEGDEILEVSISEARKLDKGDKVRTKGFVLVEPGILGTQYFYIFDGSAGIKIYSSKKNFPEVKVGDYIEVFGKVSESSGEKKINIGNKDDIILLSSDQEFPKALLLILGSINDELTGSLVFMEGDIYDLKTSKIILGNENGEIEVYLKKSTGIKKSDFEEGEKIKVLGILVPYQGGFRVLPRYTSDIEKIGKVLGEQDILAATGSEILGDADNSEVVEIAGDNKKGTIVKYLLVILGGLILILGGLSMRWYQKKKIDKKEKIT